MEKDVCSGVQLGQDPWDLQGEFPRQETGRPQLSREPVPGAAVQVAAPYRGLAGVGVWTSGRVETQVGKSGQVDAVAGVDLGGVLPGQVLLVALPLILPLALVVPVAGGDPLLVLPSLYLALGRPRDAVAADEEQGREPVPAMA